MSTLTEEYKLSLPTAILININIMLGAGLFINTQQVAKAAGVLGAFNYLIVGLLMLPLILCIVALLRIHPAGGFYTYAQTEISPFSGFLSGWSYFTSKLASAMLMIHVSMGLIQHVIPSLQGFNIFHMDIAIVCFFVALNMMNIKAGSNIQKLFIGFKIIPIFFAIFSGLFLMQSSNFSSANLIWEGIPASLPWVIYAVIGFEAACSVSSKIKNAERNAPLAVLISFAIVLMIAFLYQLLFYAALGSALGNVEGVRGIFPALLAKMFPGNELLAFKLQALLHLAIASSTLGAAYGILFSNCWNLHILAQNGHLFFSSFFAKLNNQLVPFACVVVEGLLCLLYLWVSDGNNVPLQQIGALGCVVAYAFSVWALLNALKTNTHITLNKWIGWLGLVSCAILFAACINSFFTKGMSSLIIYSCLSASGIIMFICTSRSKK
jgi:amino acid transporter